jgi:predicted ATPase with chaperone activity
MQKITPKHPYRALPMPAEHTPPVTLEVTGDGTVARRVRLDDIPDNEMAKRAVEVALAGGHPIMMIHRQGAPGPEMLSAVQGMALDAGIPFTGLAALPCPCGCFGVLTEPCSCSLRRIMGHWRRLAKRVLAFDMAVEVLPPWGKTVRRGDPEERIMAKVRRARAFAGLTDTSLSRDCEDYLAMYSRQFGTIRIPQIKDIAATVCRMDGSAKIQPHYLMEAIQYQWFWHGKQRLLGETDTPEPVAVGT